MSQNFLTLKTALSPEALRDKLHAWEPWSHRVDFDNGVSTMECVHRFPFSAEPLNKFGLAERVVPFGELTGGHLLDLGSNAGYNSIHAALKYRMYPTGVDYDPKLIEASRFLADLAGVEAEFVLENAERFCRPGAFDIALHFGTLYHLPNPLFSLQNTFHSLKPGGYLALETQVYDHPSDPNLCYFMHMQNNDASNFWALSTPVLKKSMDLIGFREVVDVMRVTLPTLAQYMTRLVLVARKPVA